MVRDASARQQRTCTQLECSRWHATGNWTKVVTASEVAAFVRAFVDATLAARGGRPSPGLAAGAG
ncbi:hypothetical protein ABZT03_40920 [Streptomyces sp. NPDC005574]|uniref:hypothetical protein n=1 Tax=Streptomyces sp. NPDC005574 TaxID=3156891 RepID=UPI0033AB7920